MIHWKSSAGCIRRRWGHLMFIMCNTRPLPDSVTSLSLFVTNESFEANQRSRRKEELRSQGVPASPIKWNPYYGLCLVHRNPFNRCIHIDINNRPQANTTTHTHFYRHIHTPTHTHTHKQTHTHTHTHTMKGVTLTWYNLAADVIDLFGFWILR